MLGVKGLRRRKANYIFVPDRQRRGGAGCLFAVLAMALALTAAGLLVNYAMNQRVELKEEKVSVMGLDKALEGFSVLHVSDLQASSVGRDLDLWRNTLYGKNFSAVVFSGDMVGYEGDYEPLLSLIHTLRQIKKDVPVYFISGDEDPAPVISTPQGTPEALSEWVREAQKMGATYLDAPVMQEVGKRRVWFVPAYLYDVDAEGMVGSLTQQKLDMEAQGLQYEAQGGATYRSLCYRLDAMQRTVEAQRQMLSTDLQIAVNHAPLEPSYIRTSIEWANREEVFNFRNISLLLCGHYCGGQWRIPGAGPIYVPRYGWFPGDQHVVGMQRVNSINQYISPGIGPSSEYPLPGRLFNAPAVTILKFTGTLQ